MNFNHISNQDAWVCGESWDSWHTTAQSDPFCVCSVTCASLCSRCSHCATQPNHSKTCWSWKSRRTAKMTRLAGVCAPVINLGTRLVPRSAVGCDCDTISNRDNLDPIRSRSCAARIKQTRSERVKTLEWALLVCTSRKIQVAQTRRLSKLQTRREPPSRPIPWSCNSSLAWR